MDDVSFRTLEENSLMRGEFNAAKRTCLVSGPLASVSAAKG